MTYRAQLSSRALGQLGGFPETALDALVITMSDVIDYPDDPLRTFPTSDPHLRRAQFGDAGLVTYLIDDASTPVSFLGSAVCAVIPLTAVTGNVAVAFAVLSYAGALTVTVTADIDAFPDSEVLVDALQDELDALTHSQKVTQGA